MPGQFSVLIKSTDVVKHVCGHYSGEMGGFMVYYRMQYNIVASVTKLPKKNQPGKNVDLFDRFTRFCTV